MYSAIDEQDVRFHLLHEKDDSRIGYEKICKEEGKPVPDDEIVRGYEVSEGEYVYVTDEDLEAAAGETYRTIDIQDFVAVDEVDPIFFERTSYLGPAAGGEKTYALLVRAMEESGLVGIASYVMRDKQQLAMALDLIDRFRGPFEPERYEDTYRTALLRVIDRKRKGKDVHVEPQAEREAPTDLLEALRASVEAHGRNGRGSRRKDGNGSL